MSTPDLEEFQKRATAAEKEIHHLKQQIASLQEDLKQSGSCKSNVNMEEFERLQQENVKLKHRIEVLKNTVEEERVKSNISKVANIFTTSNSISVYHVLCELFSDAIKSAYPDVVNVPVIITSNSKFADYQCNSSMPLAQHLSFIGDMQIIPRTVAIAIVAHLKESPLIDKCTVAKAGFINICIKRDFAQYTLCNWLRLGNIPAPHVAKKKVVVDFSSPNIAKEMHVGHLRSTIIGDSIARILEYLGHNVLRINHVGDWGTQFGMLIAHLQDKSPNYLDFMPSIHGLQVLYKESKARFDNDEEFKKRAYDCVVKLQAFDPDITKAWKMICDVSREEYEKLYERLDIKLIERGESFYQKLMESLVKYLESKNFLEEDDGRKVMWGDEEHSGIPLTLVKSDGGFTYDTSDMAAVQQRVEEERADWLIYVTEAAQSVHFQTLEKCARRAGLLKSFHKMNHVPFGSVLGEDKKKFKTRSGETIKLSELLNEGLSRSLKKLKQRGRDKVLSPADLKIAQEAVAYGCIKYADLVHNRNHEYVFSFDKMLDDRGNTAVYLLYALTRIRSIARMAKFSREKLQDAVDTHPISLDHRTEWQLAKALLKFPDVILGAGSDMYLHPLCELCYEIACMFTEFYDKCYCVEKDEYGAVKKVHVGRLLLVQATAMVLENSFDLLGLKSVERM